MKSLKTIVCVAVVVAQSTAGPRLLAAAEAVVASDHPYSNSARNDSNFLTPGPVLRSPDPERKTSRDTDVVAFILRWSSRIPNIDLRIKALLRILIPTPLGKAEIPPVIKQELEKDVSKLTADLERCEGAMRKEAAERSRSVELRESNYGDQRVIYVQRQLSFERDRSAADLKSHDAAAEIRRLTTGLSMDLVQLRRRKRAIARDLASLQQLRSRAESLRERLAELNYSACPNGHGYGECTHDELKQTFDRNQSAIQRGLDGHLAQWRIESAVIEDMRRRYDLAAKDYRTRRTALIVLRKDFENRRDELAAEFGDRQKEINSLADTLRDERKSIDIQRLEVEALLEASALCGRALVETRAQPYRALGRLWELHPEYQP